MTGLCPVVESSLLLLFHPTKNTVLLGLYLKIIFLLFVLFICGFVCLFVVLLDYFFFNLGGVLGFCLLWFLCFFWHRFSLAENMTELLTLNLRLTFGIRRVSDAISH